MPNRKYEQGARFEREVMKEYEQCGWHVIRASGSHGFFDLVAIPPFKEGFIHLIQCKVSKSEDVAERLCQKFKKASPWPKGNYVQLLKAKVLRKHVKTVLVLPAINTSA